MVYMTSVWSFISGATRIQQNQTQACLNQNNNICMNNMRKTKLKLPTAANLKKKLLPLPYIQLKVSVWAKDSHGLFDYEAQETKLEKHTYNLAKSSKIYRNLLEFTTQVVDDEDLRQMPIQSLYIGSVVVDRNSNTFEIQSPSVSGVLTNEALLKQHTEIPQDSYIVVRDYASNGVQGYQLVPGSIVRFGRVEYVVLEIRNNKSTQSYRHTSQLQFNTGNYVVERPLEGCCKICLSEDSTEEDPLISPCLCKGSCEFIHVSCLKNWINSKVKKQYGDIVLTINFSKFQCQICKYPFPKTVTMMDGQVVDMIIFEKPEKPYLILQSINNKEQNKKERNLHMIYANEGLSLKIGRGHQCELRVNDISVSRSHAEVSYLNGKFYLKDLKSKFGTLVKFREKLTIKEGTRLQYGRVCFEFSLQNDQPKLAVQDDTSEDDYSYKI